MHVRLKTLLWLVSPPLLLAPAMAVEPCGFPAWLRITHYVSLGEGGYAEDHEYFGELANT